MKKIFLCIILCNLLYAGINKNGFLEENNEDNIKKSSEQIAQEYTDELKKELNKKIENTIELINVTNINTKIYLSYTIGNDQNTTLKETLSDKKIQKIFTQKLYNENKKEICSNAYDREIIDKKNIRTSCKTRYY